MMKQISRCLLRRLFAFVCRRQYEEQLSRNYSERPIEYRFALQQLSEVRPTRILDVGTGTTAWPALLYDCGYVVTALDNIRDYWTNDVINRHWLVLDRDVTLPVRNLGHFDVVTCISVLEHVSKPIDAVANMVDLLPLGGTLIITTPYNVSEGSPNVYRRPDALYGQNAAYVCRSYCKRDLDQWLAMGLRVEFQELWCLFSGPLWATGQRTEWKLASEAEPHQLGCFAFRKVNPSVQGT
jgi:2-polyprenyl-3-methyl-5-hydroxy-6-metoxy-1,4-benzoquinol methylase